MSDAGSRVNHSLPLRASRAVVTGSARGPGLEIARGLAVAGAEVVNGRDAGSLNATVAELRDAGLSVTGSRFDVTAQVATGRSGSEGGDGGSGT